MAPLLVPPQATPAISTAGSVKGSGGEKKKGRGNQSDLKEGLAIIYDGTPSAKNGEDGAGKTEMKGQSVVDIVCVPGLGADPVKTWIQRRPVTSRDGSVTGVEEKFKDGPSMVADKSMLQKEVPLARIMVYNYASQWWGEGAVSSKVDDVALKLIIELKDKREKCENRPIIFIGHSLGGIVIEKAVVRAKIEGAASLKVFNAMAGCIFLGCPFDGSAAQMKASLVSQALGPLDMAKYTPFLKLLEDQNQQLAAMKDEFLNIVEQTRMLTCNFFEEKPTNLNKFSTASKWLNWTAFNEVIAPWATATFPGKTNIGLNVDHSGLNKFDSPNDRHWITLKNQIKKMAQEAPKAIKKRQNELSPKVDEALYIKMTKALLVEMDNPEQDLNQIRDSRADSMKATSEMTLGVPAIADFLESPSPGALMLTMLPGLDKGLRAVAIHDRIITLITAPGAADRVPPKMCYFFCDNTKRKNNALSMLKAFCYQLVTDHKPLAEDLPAEQKSTKNRLTYDSVSVLQDPFIAMTRNQTIGIVYVVIDAIDQMEEESREELFKIMKETLFASADSKYDVKVKWIFIGLERADITEALQRTDATILTPEQLGTKSQLLDSLKVVVRQKVTKLAQRMKYRKALLFSLRTEILSRSEGNLVWCELALGEIASVSPEPVNVRSFVEHLKQGLKELYDQIQYRVLKSGDKNLEYTKEILRTMMIVVQHPTPQELAVLCDLPEGVRHDVEQIKEYIKGCGSFLKVSENDETDDDGNSTKVTRVQFIDDSAREYLDKYAADALGLTKKRRIQHGILALRCLSYLQGEDAPDMNVADHDTMSEIGEHHSEHEVAVKEDAKIEDGDASMKDPAEQSDPVVADEDDVKEITAAVDDIEYPAMFWLDHAKLATDDVVEDFDLKERSAFWENGDKSKAMTWWPRLKHLEKEHPTLKKMTPVHLAAFFDFVPLLEELLKDEDKREARLKAQDSFGRQPLYWAAHEGHKNSVKLLLERGANADARSHNSPTGVCALHGAAYHGSVEIATMLVEKGARLDVMNDIMGTPLCKAAYDINAKMVVYLLSKQASLEAPKAYSMGNALGAAVWMANDVEVVKPLLEAGCSINVQYCDGDWPIYAPVVHNNPAIMEMMLEERHHANKEGRQLAWDGVCTLGFMEVFEKMRGEPPYPNIRDLAHKDPLIKSALQGETEVFEKFPKEFLTQDILDDCLYMAVDMEQEECAKLLLQLGASPNAEGDEFGCALQASAYDGTEDITRLLLAHGADPNKRGGAYAYPLQAAAVCGNINIITQLIAAGANVNAGPDGFYGNALYAAAFANELEATKLLVEKGADVNAKCDKYNYALLAAVQSSNTEIMTFLLENGADAKVTCTGEEHAMGGNALILSTFTLPATSAEILIKHGADVKHVDRDGMTPLICAAICPDSDMVELLLKHDSDVHHVSWMVGDALQAAASKGDEDSCGKLLDAGANVNGPAKSSVMPPIFFAAKMGDLETFQLLLERGADVHYRENEDAVGSILAQAILGGDKDIVDTLLNKHNFSVDTPLGKYGSPLMMCLLRIAGADFEKHTAIMRSLFERDTKPDINMVGGKYGTALQVACYRAYTDDLDFVLAQTPDVTIRGGFYGSALAAAAAENDINTIDKLERHFDGKIDDDMRNEALHAAIHYERETAIEKMLSMGADVLSVGKWGTVLENNAKGLPAEDKNSDDYPPAEADAVEEEEEDTQSHYWDEAPGKILLVPGWEEKKVEVPEKTQDQVNEETWARWRNDRKVILETAIKKVKEDRGIVDEPVKEPTAAPPKGPNGTQGAIDTNVDRSVTPPSLAGSLDIPRSANRLSISRKPLSPSASFQPGPTQQSTFPSTIVPQPLFHNSGPPAEGQRQSIPSHGGPPAQYASPPEQQRSFSGYEANRGLEVNTGTPRPPYTPQNSSYEPNAPAPPAFQPAGIQRIARRPVGSHGRVASGVLAAPAALPSAPAYSPPAQGGYGGYAAPSPVPYSPHTPPVEAPQAYYPPPQPLQTQQQQGQYQALNSNRTSYQAYSPPVTQKSWEAPPVAPYQPPVQPYTSHRDSYVAPPAAPYQPPQQAYHGYSSSQTAYPPPQQNAYNPPSQNTYVQPQPEHSQTQHRQASPPQNAYQSGYQQPSLNSSYGGIAAGAGVGAVGGAAAGYSVAKAVEDEPQEMYEPENTFTPSPPSQNYNELREATPEPGAERRYSWQEQEDQGENEPEPDPQEDEPEPEDEPEDEPVDEPEDEPEPADEPEEDAEDEPQDEPAEEDGGGSWW